MKNIDLITMMSSIICSIAVVKIYIISEINKFIKKEEKIYKEFLKEVEEMNKKIESTINTNLQLVEEVRDISKEKLDWLKSIDAIDISNYNYMIMSNEHVYSKEYLEYKSLEEIKTEYESLYSNISPNNIFKYLANERNG
ncbi:hypothetical protein Curi_c22130 [Gottschalkia acidurici 9a]|uniref:Uncharacterized protein n=1 Tax=Gottschalkia acidurici (strain ATCC 7906 / DSM 604 / BCRC 14475 / CIP 104303 / KCTC 5404 / NCIMB 10678 / 9a) TaxID=1128398 RepID=K0B3N4_GOTA9|nr:hypothetical protein [Gottschalkia acidurici]AFS79216.1 hypothetical protein Curi_c22130 [Gottschalkia acidurici 9a]